jgi:nicotinamide phosphoribosyltransferase
MGHLVNFKGTDSFEAVEAAYEYYNCEMAGFSIPATEHSTITAWGRENEAAAYEHILDVYGKPGKTFACVSDSYDLFNAVEHIWGEKLRQKLLDSGATLVVRPDSGDPLQVDTKVAELLDEKFGHRVNKKGFMVLNDAVRIIQGDGMNPYTIDHLFQGLMKRGYSAENFTVGMGGAMLQKHDRDTFSFAMKACAIRRGDRWYDVYKDPATGSGKKSKAGKLTLVKCAEYEPSGAKSYRTVRDCEIGHDEVVIETVYDSGKLLRDQTLDEIRAIADS